MLYVVVMIEKESKTIKILIKYLHNMKGIWKSAGNVKPFMVLKIKEVCKMI